MEVKYKKGEGIILNSGDKSLLISEKPEVKSDEYTVVIADKYAGKSFWINSPGEYEVGEISILAQSQNQDESIIIYELIVGGVGILYVKPGFKYSKQIHDSIGQVDVLIVELDSQINFDEVINKFDPEYLIPFGSNELATGSLQKSGITNFSNESKLKLTPDMFGSEEANLQTIIIN